MYIIVLGAAMMVSIAGVSALLAVRVQRRAALAAADAVQARLIAESIIDVARYRIATDADWRSAYSHDAWTAPETAGRATYRFKLIDEGDGDLADDPADPVRLVAEASIGDAVRLCGVLLEPRERLFADPGFESGTTGWTGDAATLATTSDTPHGGAAALSVRGRKNGSAGPARDLLGVISNGGTYTIEAWVRSPSRQQPFGFERYIESHSSGSTSISNPTSIIAQVGGRWTKISETFTVSWEGELQDARIKIVTGGGGFDFDMDDVRLIRESGSPPMRIIPGSSERVVR